MKYKSEIIVILCVGLIGISTIAIHSANTAIRKASDRNGCSQSYVAARNKVDLEYKVMVDELTQLQNPNVARILHPHLLKIADGLENASQMEIKGCK